MRAGGAQDLSRPARNRGRYRKERCRIGVYRRSSAVSFFSFAIFVPFVTLR
jgi:hypothetical protein